MKQILTLCLLALTISAMAQKPKVAIYVTGNDELNSIVADHLTDDIVRSGKYMAMERTNDFLTAISKEQTYQQSGSVDENEISQLGKQFGVNYVCVAAVANVWNEKYLTARMIDVESAEVTCSSSSNGAISNSSQLIAALNTLSNGLLSSMEYSKHSYAPKVAVYVVRTGNPDVDIVLGDQLVAGFAKSGKYLAIERTNGFLNQLQKEQGYQQSGAVEVDELARLGKQFGVKYVCVSKTTKVFGDYHIFSRLIDVEKSDIVNSYKVEGKTLQSAQEVVKVGQEIAEKLSGRTVQEEEDFQKAEAARVAEEARQAQLAKEEVERKAQQALIDRPWRELFKKVLVNTTKTYSNGKYIGILTDDGGRMGIGMYYWNDGTIYFGWHAKGERDGYGMYICGEGYTVNNCPNATVYVGNWKNNKKHGTGTCYDKNGKLIYYGKFFYDKPTEQYPGTGMSQYTFGVINYTDGCKYVGELKDGKRHGKGLLIWAQDAWCGDAWYGSWSDGIRNGYGIYMRYNGSFFQGTWKGDTYTK